MNGIKLSIWLSFILLGIAAGHSQAYTDNQFADIVIGQPDMAGNLQNQGAAGAAANTLYDPNGIFTDGTKLFICDSNNNRVLIYNTIPVADNASADIVVGQPDMTNNLPNQGAGPAANTLRAPHKVFSDGTKLFIADYGNRRVLIYNTIPTVNNASANVVVGQQNMTGGSANQGGSPGANTLNDNASVHTDGTQLFIADSFNHRVMIFNTIPTANNASADVVIGQLNMTSNSANQGGSPGANTLYYPWDIYMDGTRLLIADTGNNRTLIYNTIPTVNNASADVVVGQQNMTSNGANQGGSPGANTLAEPQGVHTDGGRLFIQDDDNHRTLIYNVIPTVNNASANIVLGQADFISNLANQGGSVAGNTLFRPYHCYVSGDHFFSADSQNHRTLIYNEPATPTPTRTATFTPTRTATFTPTRTATFTPTRTATFTPTRTASPTGTVSTTQTPTFTRSPTPSITPTYTATPSITLTATISPTLDVSVTHSATGTPTVTVTPTPTVSATATASVTASATRTISPSPTISPTPTISATHTVTPTVTLTATVTPTLTISATSTISSTAIPVVVKDIIAYPQPATGDTVYFYYKLDQPAQIEIEVYNVTGERVITLKENKPGMGYERTVWDIRDAAPGVYLYRLKIKAGGNTQVTDLKKLVVVVIRR